MTKGTASMKDRCAYCGAPPDHRHVATCPSGATIYVPLRGGDVNLTAHDRPDKDGRVTLSDVNSEVHLTLPTDLLDRLADVGDAVILVRRAGSPDA